MTIRISCEQSMRHCEFRPNLELENDSAANHFASPTPASSPYCKRAKFLHRAQVSANLNGLKRADRKIDDRKTSENCGEKSSFCHQLFCHQKPEDPMPLLFGLLAEKENTSPANL
jgi:hypothetical protein